jgi:hypothetical protein
MGLRGFPAMWRQRRDAQALGVPRDGVAALMWLLCAGLPLPEPAS